MKNTKTTIIPSTIYTMITNEAAKRCVRAGCSTPGTINNILEVQKELARKGLLPRKNFKV